MSSPGKGRTIADIEGLVWLVDRSWTAYLTNAGVRHLCEAQTGVI